MADSPNSTGGGVVTLVISADGQPVAETVRIISVDVTKRINMLPTATLVLGDGDVTEGDFEISSSKVLDPGTKVRIDAGYESQNAKIFEGVIVRHGVSVTGTNVSRLVLECRDEAVRMTIGRKNAHYVALTDADIIGKLIDAGGLKSDVGSTTPTRPELMQYYCSDWDFMLTRAEASGLLVIADGGTVSVKPPDISTAPDLTVEYGVDLMEFHADIDARSQLDTVRGVSWDPKTQAVLEAESKPESLNKQGDLAAAKLATAVGPDSYRLQTSAALDKDSLKTWTRAQQIKAGLARIRGRMRFQGSAKAAVGRLIELKGVGKHFEGNVFVSSVHHRIADGNWTTEVEFGMSPDWFSETVEIAAPPASGWTAGIEGLQIGVVQKLDGHPDGEPMVQVTLPVLQNETAGVWARLGRFYASDGVGAFFVPEIGDEVVLGFLANDPSHPVVLGSLYSSKRKPPYPLTAANVTKALVTRSNLTVEFDDDAKSVSIKTPGGNQVVLSDADKSIVVQDQNGNKVELGSSGIVLDSPKDIKISAKGKVSIDAVGAVAVTSKADVTTSGLNVSHQAKAGFVAKGNASAELSAGGQTTVKGTMVMIN